MRGVDSEGHGESMMVIHGQRWSRDHLARNMKLLTIPEVADAMKVSEKTVRRLIKRGDLPAFKVGDRGQLRVEEAELERYVESQRVRAADALAPQEVEPTE
jgi:excisionase family DNA binding protein